MALIEQNGMNGFFVYCGLTSRSTIFQLHSDGHNDMMKDDFSFYKVTSILKIDPIEN